MTTDSSPAPEGEPSLPDEVWDQFLQDSERDIRASDAPKEPSARARLVARRLREEEARAEAERRSRRGRTRRRAISPPGRWSGGSDAAEGRARRRTRLRGVAGVVVVVILLLVVLAPGRAWSFLRGNGDHHDGNPGPVPTTVVPQPDPQRTIRT
ncbi:hypothetical protein OG552_03185 [Streptomyces sp. NBC_01476]|uniref:hypothetical protein n=1 Tax=Streptomyces sp. NBC_01476 TaxID=2903881 RepID=UPI002E37A8A6|nr:hypothetical protein [Streptomyces sp. NBC_01476]